MKTGTCIIFITICLISISSYAQLTVKDQESTPNTLLQVNDEGSAGSLTLPPLSTIGAPENKLYNIGTSLYWNGTALGTSGSAGGWTDDGSVVRLSSASDKIGIGTLSPSAALHVTGNDGVLFTGTYGTGIIPMEGAGARMMWYPQKAAFRAGAIVAYPFPLDGISFWNDDSIGEYSTALGQNTVASGNNSTAIGFFTSAKGWGSTAMGLYSKASGYGSTALGEGTAANGSYSTAMGLYSKANSYLNTVIGKYNLGSGTVDSWIETDPLFEIGNGTSSQPSNALTVLKNGNVGIGIHNPSYKLDISGGNFLVRGIDGYTAIGHTGIIYLGSVHSNIMAEFGYGVKISAYAAPNAISIKQLSGDVGIGTTTPKEKLEVAGKIRSNSGFNVNGTNGVGGTYYFATNGLSGVVESITVEGGIITSVNVTP